MFLCHPSSFSGLLSVDARKDQTEYHHQFNQSIPAGKVYPLRTKPRNPLYNKHTNIHGCGNERNLYGDDK